MKKAITVLICAQPLIFGAIFGFICGLRTLFCLITNNDIWAPWDEDAAAMVVGMSAFVSLACIPYGIMFYNDFMKE